jgi:hypothetical protein
MGSGARLISSEGVTQSPESDAGFYIDVDDAKSDLCLWRVQQKVVV